MTRIPVPEARRSSPSVSRRKRHVAGNESVKKNEMTDILDPNVKSKPVLPSGVTGTHWGRILSEVAFGILSVCYFTNFFMEL